MNGKRTDKKDNEWIDVCMRRNVLGFVVASFAEGGISPSFVLPDNMIV